MIPSITSRNQNRNKFLRVVIPLAFWLGVWQLASFFVDRVLLAPSLLLLPGPVPVAKCLWSLMGTADFWRAAGMSLSRIFGGFLAGAAAGTVLAALVCALPWADWLIAPAVRVVRAVPVASFIVLVLLWAPTGRVPAVISALMVLPVVWGNVCRGIRETDPKLLELARAYRFGRWKILRLVYVPSALPYFASGCSTALGLAWKSGVAAEVLCQPRLAIGSALYAAKITIETPALFAWTLVVIVLSLVLEAVLGVAFRRWERGTKT